MTDACTYRESQLRVRERVRERDRQAERGRDT